MQPERNSPCPCGSGKKYKKCCYINEKKTVAEIQLKPQDIKYKDTLFDFDLEEEHDDTPKKKVRNNDYLEDFDDDDDEDIFGSEQGAYLDLFTNLRKFLLRDKSHYREYVKIRKMHGEIINAMINYHQNGKFIHQENNILYDKDYKSLYLLKSDFDLSTQKGTQGLYDILIYKTIHNMNCITEVFIKKEHYKKQEKKDFLNNMLNSKPGLFEVTAINMEEGYAYIKNMLTGAENKIVDVGLSGNQNNDDVCIYTRIITHNGISFSSGLNLVFKKDSSFIKEHIKRHMNNFSEETEFTRFIELYNHYMESSDKVEVYANSFN